MKCIAAVVMMAFAVAAEAGYVPLLYSAPLAYSGHTTVVQGNQAAPAKITEYQALAYSAPAYAPYSYPSYYAYPAPAPIAYSAPAVLLQKEARYLAANRGAIHEAPLPGHELSQQQLNLQPAA
ncbi:adult cuticle protein 1-like [Ochlerotatus camptorhynchus]|uniref:adult cuticle protein 1-like n=1 Tax=Ochlerotatus camptorhynchus TaxID=644619 RepID=UPI0031E38E8F